MDYKKELSQILAGHLTELTIADIYEAIEQPPDPEMGDFAFPCFRLAKVKRQAPNQIAADIAAGLTVPPFLERIQVAGAYINFYLDKTVLAQGVIEAVQTQKNRYGSSGEGEGKAIVLDYSSPNIAKPFHVGHLRSTVIGNALYQMFSFLGYKAIGINHLGDWGTQFGKLIVAYQKWGNKEEIEKNGIAALSAIYVRFHEEAEKDESLNDEARGWLVKMQEGDREALDLWQWFNDISLAEFNRIYDKLGITFDYFTGESFYNDKMDAVVEELKEKDLLTLSEGASIVDLEAYQMPPCLILRKDGGTLYPTRDIAAAMYRKKTYDFHKALYVTALDQNLHFAQWFKVIEMMGHDWARDLIHVPFGLVSLESGKLSTRKGHVVLMEELIQEAIQKTEAIIQEKNPDLPNKKAVAEQVGIGAMIFNDLYNSRIKNVVFSWEHMLNFNGETGPYVQYTHARANRILAKAGAIEFTGLDYEGITDETSMALVKELMNFPDKIKAAVDKLEPYIVSRQLVAICQAFNKFYDTHKNILGSETSLRQSRLCLIDCTRIVLATGLGLLGIAAPEQM